MQNSIWSLYVNVSRTAKALCHADTLFGLYTNCSIFCLNFGPLNEKLFIVVHKTLVTSRNSI